MVKLYSFYNLGNTCYLNSVLQCFISIPGFKNLFKKENEVTQTLKDNIHVDLTDNGEFINHKHLPQKITRYFGKKFRVFQQHDAHEFFLEFLDTIDIKEFYGKTKMNITCSCCGNVSSTLEDFCNINLDCDCSSNLTELFIKYLEKEEISDYHCDKCNKKVLAEKKLYLDKLPCFLVIVLKKYTPFGAKTNGSISYPFDNNLIRESESGIVFNYSLYAVIYHHGNSERGHYNCSIKVNGNWFLIDDDTIQLNKNMENNNANSYMLFYKNEIKIQEV
jgi:ubiquitin carboxyl-terminal hydrolase 36/42